MKNVLLVLLLIVGMPGLADEGHATGNGGGVICINGQCKTLIESGLQLKPEYEGVWMPSANNYALVDTYLQRGLSIPARLRQDIYFRVFGRADHFRQVEVIDAAKLEVIKNQYLEIAKDAGFPIDPSTFEVVAFSSDETVKPAMTYLLPKFFQLTEENQAKILIHEGLYRGRPTSDLRSVLQLENTIYSQAKLNETPFEFEKPCSGQVSSAQIRTCIDQQILVYRLGLLPKANLVGTVLSLTYSLHFMFTSPQSRINLEWFGSRVTTRSQRAFQLDPQKLLVFAGTEPRLPYIFSKIDTLSLKFLRTELGEDSDKLGFNVNWSERGETTLRYCLRTQKYSSQLPYDCDVFSIDDTNLQLMLPN